MDPPLRRGAYLADWDPARARRLGQDWRIARYHRGDWPGTRTVIARFGSMSNAVRAAGLPPRPIGSHGHRRLHERAAAQRDLATSLAAEACDRSTATDTGVQDLAEARRFGDPAALRDALIDVAAQALAWAEHAEVEPSG